MGIIRRIKLYIASWYNTLPWIGMSIIKNTPSRTLRLQMLRLGGAKISKHVSIFHNVQFRGLENLNIQEGCSIGPSVLLDARNGLSIGKNVTVAYDAIIWTQHHEMNSNDFHTCGGPVEIGDYSWICSRSIILPGVKIGKGAVVASGAVVTKDVEEFAIVAGIPAKKIAERTCKNFTYEPFYNIHVV